MINIFKKRLEDYLGAFLVLLLHQPAQSFYHKSNFTRLKQLRGLTLHNKQKELISQILVNESYSYSSGPDAFFNKFCSVKIFYICNLKSTYIKESVCFKKNFTQTYVECKLFSL